MPAKVAPQKKFSMYKDKPLVRCGNTIYYGSMSDSHIIKLEIKSSEKNLNIDVANLVNIQLISTDPDLTANKKIIKSTEKNGLYTAIDVADAWLHRIV